MNTLEDAFRMVDCQLPVQVRNRPEKLKRQASKLFLRKNIHKLESDFRESILNIIGTGERGPGVKCWKKELINRFLENKRIHENEIFNLFKKGRHEMKGFIRYAVTERNKKDRVWIQFIGNEYRVIGVGESKPKGWTGFTPKDS